MGKNIERLAGILGIISFVGTIISWAWDNDVALCVTLGLLILSLLVLIIRYKIKRFDPSKAVEIYKPITDDIWISSDRSNRQSIDNKFLTWDECTILFWMFVPRRGEGLRNAPHNRYIFAHQTGEGENWHHYNAFFLRYSSKNTWDLIFSNPRGELTPDNHRFRFDDGLEAGWHRVQITWNHSIPLLTFLIDGGDRISIRYKSHLNYWPRERDDAAYIGAWVNPYPESYCETKIAHFWILNKALESTDSTVQEHSALISG